MDGYATFFQHLMSILTAFNLFTRSLRERNALLKRGGKDSEFAAFEQMLAHSAIGLQRLRVQAFPSLKSSYLGLITPSRMVRKRRRLSYLPNLPHFKCRGIVFSRYRSDRDRDQILSSTFSSGPTRMTSNFC